MPVITYPDYLDRLLPVAERQDGYFTSEQAREQDVSPASLAKLTTGGHLTRSYQGVYRVSRWPGSKHPGLWAVYLWVTRRSPSATLSHRTALELHGISDINADRIDVTVPRKVRIRSSNPRNFAIHHRDFTENEVEAIDGLPVTKIYRTILDLAVDRIARDEVAGVLDGGFETLSHPLSARELLQVRALFDLDLETRDYLSRARERSSKRHLAPAMPRRR